MKLIATSIAASGLLAALTMALAVPVRAQSLIFRYSIPFDFVASGQTLPAGDYLVGAAYNHDTVILNVRNVSTDAAVLVLTAPGPAARSGDRDKEVLLFHRYEGDYFLAGIWDGSRDISRAIPMSKTERDRATTAPRGKPEEATVLARR
jgi:hypothetical protein